MPLAEILVADFSQNWQAGAPAGCIDRIDIGDLEIEEQAGHFAAGYGRDGFVAAVKDGKRDMLLLCRLQVNIPVALEQNFKAEMRAIERCGQGLQRCCRRPALCSNR